MYRRLGLTTAADIEKYEVDLAKRVCHFAVIIIRIIYFSCDVDTGETSPCSGLPFIRKASGPNNKQTLIWT